MANALTINISAVDRATKVIQDLNKRTGQMMRPIQNMERSVKQFGRAAGFGVVKEKLDDLTHSARRVVGAFGKIGAPLLALVGGGTIAGLLALTDGWARFGLQVSQTAQILGVNTQALYDFQNASRLVGIQGDAATQTFQSFADTLQDARWGRNQAAYGLLIGLGVQLKTTKAGAIDSMDALGQVADKIHQLQQAGNTGGARTIARELGVTSLLPVLMQGRKALEDYEAQARKLAGTMDWKQAAAAAMQWNRLHVAMEGTKNTIAAALLPTITPLVTQFGAWIQTNRQLIATDLTDFLKELGNAFKGLTLKTVLDDTLAIVKAMLGLVTDIADLTSHLGGLKGVLEGMAGLWAASKILTFGRGFLQTGLWITGATKKLIAWQAARTAAGAAGTAARGATATEALLAAPSAMGLLGATGIGLAGAAAVYGGAKLWEHHELAKLNGDRIAAAPMAPSVMRYFERQGWTTAQAAGITANIQAESGYDPRAVGDNGQAAGIGQWHPDRQALFNTWAAANKMPDLSHADLIEQLQFYDYELKHSAAGKKLAGATNAIDAGRIVSFYDERPAAGAAEAARRGALADQLASAPSPYAAPPVNVTVQNTIHANGAATTRVQTPSGVKIVHTSPVAAVS